MVARFLVVAAILLGAAIIIGIAALFFVPKSFDQLSDNTLLTPEQRAARVEARACQVDADCEMVDIGCSNGLPVNTQYTEQLKRDRARFGLYVAPKRNGLELPCELQSSQRHYRATCRNDQCVAECMPAYIPSFIPLWHSQCSEFRMW
jgi:hypothetical protein